MNNHEQENILITSCSIDENVNEVLKMVQDDDRLITEVTKYCKKLVQDEDVEIFDQFKNIVVTSQGYIMAFWESDLTRIVKFFLIE